MNILDMRTGEGEAGEIIDLEWNFTIGEERVIMTLATGFKVEIYTRELDKIRPSPQGGRDV